MKWDMVIGLEIHVELATDSKMFCRCSAQYFGNPPNTHTCPVCLALPGALPVPNEKAIEYTAKIGLAFGSEIPTLSKFDRKNYFYPDLPKGYQISQFDLPVAVGGEVEVGQRKVRLNRVHLEEDTGKLMHVGGETLIDFNRSGVPLVEIVSEPDMTSAEQARSYAQGVQQTVRYLGVSDADMEEGSLRVDANISLKPEGSETLGTKVEIKNLNSFRSLFRAVEYEKDRQQKVLEKGEKVVQETRGWDEVAGKTVGQRSKEEAHDYRYFPEPDLLPLVLDPNKIDELKSTLPELASAKLVRFCTEYQLSEYDAEILVRDLELADYFEEAVRVGGEHEVLPKQIANEIINRKIDITQILPAALIEGVILGRKTLTLKEGELETVIKEVIADNDQAVQDYKKGKENALMFLVGLVVRKFPEKIDATSLKEMIEREVKKTT